MGLLTGLCPAADNQEVTAPSGKGGEPAIVETGGLDSDFWGVGEGGASRSPCCLLSPSFLPSLPGPPLAEQREGVPCCSPGTEQGGGDRVEGQIESINKCQRARGNSIAVPTPRSRKDPV